MIFIWFYFILFILFHFFELGCWYVVLAQYSCNIIWFEQKKWSQIEYQRQRSNAKWHIFVFDQFSSIGNSLCTWATHKYMFQIFFFLFHKKFNRKYYDSFFYNFLCEWKLKMLLFYWPSSFCAINDTKKFLYCLTLCSMQKRIVFLAGCKINRIDFFLMLDGLRKDEFVGRLEEKLLGDQNF